MTENVLLAARMAAAGLKQQELADALNQRIEIFTGSTGTVSDRQVRNWLTGKSVSPRARQRRALEEEFGCSATELGFTDGASYVDASPAPAPSEDPVRRRAFAGTAAAVAVAAAFPPTPNTAAPRIGMSDADRLETAFVELVSADNQHGGTISLETRALAFAQHATELQTVSQASQRVRSRLYYLAAAFTGTALWVALDARQPGRAARHLDRAMTLAGLAGSSDMQLRLWGHAAVLFTQQHKPNDALAAAEAGRASFACRRDPLMRSLASARLAGIQGEAKENRSALSNFDLAVEAYDRADLAEPRATWLDFYDQSELFGLGGLTMGRLGHHAQAEAYLHRTLAKLRSGYTRNRLYYSAHLALAQLRQDDLEHACTTAASVLGAAGNDSLTARTSLLMDTFTRELLTAAPGARSTTQWMEQYTSMQGGRP
nr:helix-turn-helix domain-containing protein [Streptomyces sp. NBC_00857]